MAKGFTVYQALNIPAEYNHVAGAVVAVAGLTAVGVLVRAKLATQSDRVLPDANVSFLNVVEGVASFLRNILQNIIGPGADTFLAVIGTTFLFVLTCNLLGIVPGFLPPTENINTNLGMALCIFVIYQFLGIKEHGFHYLKQFTGGLPVTTYGFVMTVFLSVVALGIFAIELIGHVFRPASLSLRLWGNINGDHTLAAVAYQIQPLFLPIIVMLFGIFISVVQALVFSLLSSVYIKLAVSHDH